MLKLLTCAWTYADSDSPHSPPVYSLQCGGRVVAFFLLQGHGSRPNFLTNILLGDVVFVSGFPGYSQGEILRSVISCSFG